MFTSVDPSTGFTLATYPETSEPDLERALRASVSAQDEWSRVGVKERAGPLRALASGLRAAKTDLAALMATEMGKPLAQGAAEVEKCAWVCEHYADTGPELLEPESVDAATAESFVAYRPLGVVLAIMPWNFPLWQVVRFAAPTLLAGNAALLKPAPNVAGCARALDDLFAGSGLPQGAFQTIRLDVGRVASLIADPRVAAVTLTGSARAGRSVARTAGAHLKKAVLELGGSDPYVVLADADVALAAETCVASRMINSGQSCIAAKRFIVVEPLVAEFTDRCAALVSERTAGDPTAPDADLGPLARTDLRTNLERQVAASIALGAGIVAAGTAPTDRGAFYAPQLLGGVRPGMPAFDEETFGPVGAIVSARDDSEAIRLANLTSFGLGAAVFTSDVERGRRIATEDLHAGVCFVNELVKSDPRLPFGGIRGSGFGRELGVPGIREFVNCKTVAVGPAT